MSRPRKPLDKLAKFSRFFVSADSSEQIRLFGLAVIKRQAKYSTLATTTPVALHEDLKYHTGFRNALGTDQSFAA